MHELRVKNNNRPSYLWGIKSSPPSLVMDRTSFGEKLGEVDD